MHLCIFYFIAYSILYFQVLSVTGEFPWRGINKVSSYLICYLTLRNEGLTVY